MHINQQNILVGILSKKGFKLQEASNLMLGFDRLNGNQLEIPLHGNETSFNVKTTEKGQSKTVNVSGFDGLTEFLNKIK